MIIGDIFMVLLGLGVVCFIVLAVILGIYSALNYFLCTSKLDYDKLPSFYRIVRNGDNTISLERKELFGFWNVQYIDNFYNRNSLPDTEHNMDILKKQIADEREAIKIRIQRKLDNMSKLEKHKAKPKIAHTDP